MSESQPEEDQEVTHLSIGRLTVEEFIVAATGDRVFSVTQSDMPLSSALGLLRLAEHWLLVESDVDDDGGDVPGE